MLGQGQRIRQAVHDKSLFKLSCPEPDLRYINFLYPRQEALWLSPDQGSLWWGFQLCERDAAFCKILQNHIQSASYVVFNSPIDIQLYLSLHWSCSSPFIVNTLTSLGHKRSQPSGCDARPEVRGLRIMPESKFYVIHARGLLIAWDYENALFAAVKITL